MNKLEEYKIDIEGFKYIYYDNQSQNPTIIFIHGLGSNKDPMTKFFKGFEENFRCIYLDLPAHNNIPSYEFSKLDNYSEYIIRFISYLNLKNFYLVGFSFGGLISVNTSKILFQRGLPIKTVAWASPLEKSFLTFKSKQFLKIFDRVNKINYKKLPTSSWFKLLTAIFGIKVKNRELESFTNFDNATLDKLHAMMPDKQIDVKDLNVLYLFGTKDPLINDKAFEKTLIFNENQKKFLIKKGGHYLSAEGRKEALNKIYEFLKN